MTDARERDWPLVAFTVAIQAAAGLALAAASADALAAPAMREAEPRVAWLVLGLAGAGAGCSLFHLGRGLRAWRALANLRRSPLSREVLATIVFAGAALGSVAASMTGGARASSWTMATAIAGVTAMAAAIPVYRVPARPVWNAWWVTASFVGSVLLLGGATLSAIVAGHGARPVLDLLLAAATIGAALQILSAGAMARRFSREWRHASSLGLEGSAMGWTARRRLWLGLQIALAGILPVLAYGTWWVACGRADGACVTATATTVAAASLAGIVEGRRLMFDLGASVPRF